MRTYTVKTDAEQYDIDASSDEEAIKIAKEEVRLTPALIADGAWLRVMTEDGAPVYYEGE